MKRGESGLCAVLAIDKPAGCTSHDVVSRLRRLTGERRVGHAGTLDPFATGLLIACIGPATRLSDLLMGGTKDYLARIVLGQSTDTDDCEGEIVFERDVPEGLAEVAFAHAALSRMVGAQNQIPPRYSAKKVAGRKAYEAARSGEEIELTPVRVEVFRAELAGVSRDGRGRLCWDARFSVSKGTYIRALARDLGASLGCGAHLGALRRIRIGACSVQDAVDLDALEAGLGPGGRLDEAGLAAICADPVGLLGLPAVEALPEQAERVAHGAAIRLVEGQALLSPEPCADRAGALVSVVSEGRLSAIYEREGKDRLRCKIMIPGGVAGALLAPFPPSRCAAGD